MTWRAVIASGSGSIQDRAARSFSGWPDKGGIMTQFKVFKHPSGMSEAVK
ncbi:hypothetical protein AWB68_01605 [Caballeronia choica]|uniref:Uncharacterized protein n=1 Tax=Caballeronia choica TaxID=326476 RepID=A0A158GYG4_9BURK|nr:hypothetical protein AWB68_01605 [Caballeronia choica]